MPPTLRRTATTRPAAPGARCFPGKDSEPQQLVTYHCTGCAAGESEALAAARNAYDRAVQQISAGRPAPDDSSDGWAARGLRPDWVLDWHKATTTAWVNPSSLI
ncbi:hypothetical protein [Streptomyces daghestanicus]|uniref:Uncharacterized protein n=1 Tax=Streptomyces daghestanicus TaxID=66885 RepID=A0ABQ3Q7E8_9ACTN|nr:hypothetical protein [Streptomyces daghestanicus]GGU66561.1 hypothetical protein GCM10010259_66070 [Streptomyces daghestanicus]GHI33209.1 hypothetical protein Sdagh_49390 [Streptomyces daghestanicus]